MTNNLIQRLKRRFSRERVAVEHIEYKRPVHYQPQVSHAARDHYRTTNPPSPSEQITIEPVSEDPEAFGMSLGDYL